MDKEPTASSRILEVENCIETYRTIAEWIRFADAKAGVTLTVNGLLMGVLLPTLKTYLAETTARPTSWWVGMVVVLFLGWLGFVVLSAIASFMCILPLRGQSRQLALHHTSHFHPAAISQHFALGDVERFQTDAEKIGTDGLKREIMTAILIDAHLSSAKYRYVTRSIWFLAGSVVFGVLYLLAIQF